MDEERKITDDLSDIETPDLLKALPNYFDFSGDINATAYLTWRFDAKRDVEKNSMKLERHILIRRSH